MIHCFEFRLLLLFITRSESYDVIINVPVLHRQNSLPRFFLQSHMPPPGPQSQMNRFSKTYSFSYIFPLLSPILCPPSLLPRLPPHVTPLYFIPMLGFILIPESQGRQVFFYYSKLVSNTSIREEAGCVGKQSITHLCSPM